MSVSFMDSSPCGGLDLTSDPDGWKHEGMQELPNYAVNGDAPVDYDECLN